VDKAFDQETQKVGEVQASTLADAAASIRDAAIERGRVKLAAPQRELGLESLLNYNPTFFDYFKYELASGVARILAENDHNVQAIYMCDPAANPECEIGGTLPLSATVHLIVKAKTVSAALEAFVAALDRALTASLRDLPSPLFEKRAFILNASLVTEEDIRLRHGHAALISSLFAPALKIWRREA
jgi:hypothetical protein